MNRLQEIENVILNYTAFEFATEQCKVEDEDTLEDMRGKWGISTDTIRKCRERSFNSSLNKYAEAIKLYTGFIKNGKVFALDKRDRYISFLYSVDKKSGTARFYTHYNPLKVDCIEFSTSIDHLFNNEIESRYEFSKDEGRLIKECNALIKETTIA